MSCPDEPIAPSHRGAEPAVSRLKGQEVGILWGKIPQRGTRGVGEFEEEEGRKVNGKRDTLPIYRDGEKGVD